MKHKFFILILFILPLALACEKKQDTPKTENIFGLWRYQSGIDLQVFDNSSPHFPLAYLDLNEDKSISGFTARNIFEGNFTHDADGNIELNIIGMTRVADTPWSGEFTKMLSNVRQYRLEGDQLILINTETGGEYTFIRLTDETCLPVINDHNVFQLAESDEFGLLEVNVLGNCLELLIEYSGGCKGIGVALIGGGIYAESEPPQLAIKIVVEDNDDCEALVREHFYFDITDLQYEGSNQLILNIEDWKDPVLVNYQ